MNKATTASKNLVEVTDLKKHFPVQSGILDRKEEFVRAVDGISFSIPEGKTFGLVGESGCGKTTAAKTVLRIHEPTEGSVIINGTDIASLSRKELRKFRKNMQIVHQDPGSSLNPRKRIKDIIATPMEIHETHNKKERRERVKELIDIVDLPQEYLYKYPKALSGGMKQRVSIARAIALNPKFIVLDEPTSALDVSVQARIVKLLKRLQAEFGLTYLFISHDISLIRNIADFIGVMYLGEFVEVGETDSVFLNPQHPYTRALLSSVPTVHREDENIKPKPIELKGEIPDPMSILEGCPFRTRCPKEFDACKEIHPGFYQINGEHKARCLLHDEEYSPTGPQW